MKLQRARLRHFKRFSDLTVEGVPETAKLVIIAGPNGSGKTSFFEALQTWHRLYWQRRGFSWSRDYYVKLEDGDNEDDRLAIEALEQHTLIREPDIQFYGQEAFTQNNKIKALYVRSAHRNDPEFKLSTLNVQPSPLEENRFWKLTQNDATVSSNYQRLVSQAFQDAFQKESPDVTLGEFRTKAIGDLRESVGRLFPGLLLNDFGNPLVDGTFHFDKGRSKSFTYENLSGGEKSAFDLILDLIVKKAAYDDTVFCIDEPEIHMNTALQGDLLAELFRLTPQTCQMWLATHSIGMMRRARDLYRSHPGEVVFLDFGGRDFDQPVVVRPEEPTRQFWQRTLDVALDDLASLVAPERIVLCEGGAVGPNAGRHAQLDAVCYEIIFSTEFPETRFLSIGNADQVENDKLGLIEAMKALLGGTEMIRLIDRDGHSPADIDEKRAQGVRVLTQRNLESYLFQDEVLQKLCETVGKPDAFEELKNSKENEIQSAIGRGKAADDLKACAGGVFNAAKKILGLTDPGNNTKAFMRATLAPLVTPDMPIYGALKDDIFGH